MPKRQIRVGNLVIPESDKRVIRTILDSGQISPGPYVKRFENEFARYHGARHGLFVNSGTDALRIALATLKEVHGWKDGDLVAVPNLTFVATVNIILQCGLKPLFVQVGMYDFNMNPWNLDWILGKEGKYPNLRAIIPVHLFGQPCDMGHIMEIAKDRGLKVIEDSCETMGVSKIEGDIACYSTYVAHLIATGVGGLAITNNDEYADVMRSYANHGRNTFYVPGYRKPTLSRELLKRRFQFERIGYSCRLTEMEAALGLGQLSRLKGDIAKRQKVAAALEAGLSRFQDLVLSHPKRESAWMMFPVVLSEQSRIDKWDLCLFLEEQGIETREMLPLTNQPCYWGMPEFTQMDEQKYGNSSVASWVNEKGFYIGCHPGMNAQDVEYVVNAFQQFFRSSRRGPLTKTKFRVHFAQAHEPARV